MDHPVPPQSLQLEQNWGDKTTSISIAEARFLATIHYDSACTAKDLSACCYVRPSSVYKILHRMVAKGLIEAHRVHREQLRSSFVRYRLTPFGVRTLEALEAAALHFDENDYEQDRKSPSSKRAKR
jgi:DNA-binding MarR family transcriptional regulator